MILNIFTLVGVLFIGAGLGVIGVLGFIYMLDVLQNGDRE
jgi:hypothetical protein